MQKVTFQEILICDVIKIRLKRKNDRRSGKAKGNPEKRDGFRPSFMTSHMTLSVHTFFKYFYRGRGLSSTNF